MGEPHAGHVQDEEKTSDETDEEILVLVDRLIPIVKKRVLRALDRSPEDVESEVGTLANLLTIREYGRQD
jgi:hypothetical protein